MLKSEVGEYMDLQKVGAFIAKLRKEKGMTQEKLGDKLGVSSKTVSKWERGVNAPDIALLTQLSDILGIGVNELLNGEYKTKENEKRIDNPVQKIQFYTKKTKLKYLKIAIYLTVIICLIFTGIFFINNYNKFQMYSITSKNDNFFVDGYVVYNQSRNIFLIKNIDIKDHNIGTDAEDKVKQIIISIVNKGKNIYSITYEGEDELQPINSYLLNRTYFFDEIVNNEEKSLTSTTDLNKTSIEIKYKNQKDQIKEISIPLKIHKEYSNNKLIY